MVVWDNATDEMGVSLVQRRQQGIKLRSEGRRHSLEGFWSSVLAFLLLFPLVGIFLWLARVVSEDNVCGIGIQYPVIIIGLPEEIDHQLIVTLLQKIHHSVIDLILVLCQPVCDVVVDDAGVVSKSKVGIFVF